MHPKMPLGQGVLEHPLHWGERGGFPPGGEPPAAEGAPEKGEDSGRKARK